MVKQEEGSQGSIRSIAEVMEGDNAYTRYLARGGKPRKFLLELERRRPRGTKVGMDRPVRKACLLPSPTIVSKPKRGRGRPRKNPPSTQVEIEEIAKTVRKSPSELKSLKDAVMRMVEATIDKKIRRACERMEMFTIRGLARSNKRCDELEALLMELKHGEEEPLHPNFFDPTWRGKEKEHVDVGDFVDENLGMDEAHAIAIVDDEEEI